MQHYRHIVSLGFILLLLLGSWFSLEVADGALASTTRLSANQATKIAEAAVHSQSHGTTSLLSATVAPASFWGIPSSQLKSTTLVWQVVLAGRFDLACGGPALCPDRAPGPAPAVACPLMPATTLPPVFLCNQQSRRATVEIKDTNSRVLQVSYQDLISSVSPNSTISIRHPKNGEQIVLTADQKLRLGTPSASLVWSSWNITSGQALAKLSPSASWGQWFQAQAVGVDQLTITGRPHCNQDTACPQFILLTRISVRVMPVIYNLPQV